LKTLFKSSASPSFQTAVRKSCLARKKERSLNTKCLLYYFDEENRYSVLKTLKNRYFGQI